ncbi:methyltransferase domain-containing protein [Candidatus Woesearchaeota archaeon]|nr:methyltransferase domain-containing protein [Candidatus Woesearchaeota archaeon]
MKKQVFRLLANFVFRTGQFNNRSVREFAQRIRDKTILELGSGRMEGGKYSYSLRRFFDRSNRFLQSDVVKEFGHRVVDVTKMNYKSEFDVILCTNVLEHVFDFHKAVVNIYAALKSGGAAVIFVPAFYPLHDEPNDFWRFTEHSLKILLKKFRRVEIRHSGLRQYPFAYYVEAYK